jgi:hypothetical protein
MVFRLFRPRLCWLIFARGKEGFEAFDQQERSHGLFKTQQDAAAAVMRSPTDIHD